MTLFTSGDWHCDAKKILTESVFEFVSNRYEQLKDVVIEVNQVDLSADNAFGFCQVDEDGEFLVHIHNDLVPTEYAKTLCHELVHVRQTIDGLFNGELREEEAYVMEDILSKEFWDSYGSGIFFSTAWTNIGYNNNVNNQGGQ
tara:strand:+ start:174 stop:602 length:429 start_codon:yes stop_codon:yes gene_type:complete